MKGLPLAYSKDMQEDKEGAFDALDSLELCIAAIAGMTRDMSANRARMRKAAGAGYATATDLADWLVRALGLPFREAHHVTGRIVGIASDTRRRTGGAVPGRSSGRRASHDGSGFRCAGRR
jgi:argininosuccinate lyase